MNYFYFLPLFFVIRYGFILQEGKRIIGIVPFQPAGMKFLLIVALLITQNAFCQFAPSEEADLHKMEINKDIFRVMMTTSIDASLTFSGCYEHSIFKSLTAVVKAGPSISWEDNFNDAIDYNEYRWFLKVVASAELRYYYNLRRRIRLEKTTRNFSACYFSLEPFLKSRSLIILNKYGAESKPGKAGIYINIGYQKQVRRTYLNAFFGTRFFGNIYSNSVDVFDDILQVGVTIGRAF